MRLDRAAAERAMKGLGDRMGRSVQDAAVAIQEVVNENMALAARMHAVERGEDPRRFTLIAFGGAGPVHAWRVADILKIERFLVPLGAGVASAAGLLVSPPAIELSASRVGRFLDMDLADVDGLLAELRRSAESILAQAGVTPEDMTVQRLAECRYVGQAYEVQVALPDGSLVKTGADRLVQLFEDRYRELYGRVLPGGVVEALTWRVHVRGPAPATGFILDGQRRGGESARRERRAYFTGLGFVSCPVHDRYALRSGVSLDGPLLIEEDESTTVVGPRAKVTVDDALNLVVRLG
jgi:N-methylhydantoinase A